MTTMAIIGTAGRRSDKPLMSRKLWTSMWATARLRVYQWKPTKLVSGGAAWADHLAVQLYIEGVVPELKLYLPADFRDYGFLSTGHRSPGGVSNYYHGLMSKVLGWETLFDIQKAIDQGAEIEIIPGFKARNNGVARADYMLAMTFGTHSGLYTPGTPGYLSSKAGGVKDGGTADTWTKCQSAQQKYHKNLHEFL